MQPIFQALLFLSCQVENENGDIERQRGFLGITKVRGCRRLSDMDAYRLKPMIPESSATGSSNHQVHIITSGQITKTPTPSSSRKSESQWLRLNGTYILRCSPSREFPYIHVCRCTCCAFLARLTYMRYLLGYMYIVYSFSLKMSSPSRVHITALSVPSFFHLLLLNRSSDIGGGETPYAFLVLRVNHG
jgi:hypothetical protein